MPDNTRRDEQTTTSQKPVVGKNAPTRTRTDTVIVLLKRRRGATIDQLMEATGWQAHSVRGFLSGTLRKRMGLTVISEKSANGERRYRIDGGKA